jgi:hypothetical protein
MRIMSKIVLLSALILFAQTDLCAEGSFVFLKPTTFDQSVKLTVSGKSRQYYVVDRESRLTVTISGPSELKIMSRLELHSQSATPDYSFEVTNEETKKTKTVHHSSKYSEKSEFADKSDSFLGVLRSKVIDIPSGSHTYVVHVPESSSERVFVRLSQKTNEFTGGTSVVAITPFEYTSPIDLVSNETVYTYYRIGGVERAALRLVGPATLKVLSRLEYTPEMKGTQKWKVQVIEDGTPKKSYALAGNTSDVNQYAKPCNLLPSRAETFFVEIPDGEHVYEFRLPEDARTSLLRFLLPKQELAGEKK